VLLVGVAGGAVLTTVAGARRSSTAYERLRSLTLASDMDLAFDGPPDGGIEAAADAARALPEVVALSRTDYPFIVPAGSGLYPFLDFLAAAAADEASWEGEVDRPRVLEGRVPDADALDEIAISNIYARETGLGVGDRAEFESYAPDQLEALFTTGDAGPPAGPRFTLVVTGVFDAPLFLSDSSGNFQPRAFLTPAFLAAHRGDVATYPGGFSVRLRDAADDVQQVADAMRARYPGSRLEITPSSEIDEKIESSIDVIVSALALCALVAALAGAVAVAQALTRHFASQGSSDRWLSALGMTRWERVVTKTAMILPVALLGALLAVALSLLASPLMPVGIARRAEPDPGLSVDGPVLLLGFVVVALAVVVLSLFAATVVNRRERLAIDERSTTEPSRWVGALARTNVDPPVTIGVGMALQPRGGTAWPVRSAFLGVAFGVMGLVAVLVFVASVDDLFVSPDRYGSPFDADVSGFSGNPLEEGGGALLDDPRVAGAGLGFSGRAHIGDTEVNSYAFESLKGDMKLTMLDGHPPTGDAEVALGRSTLESAHVGVGDEIEIDGVADSVRATVVGVAVFPVVDERSSAGRGVLLGRDDFERISDPGEINADVVIDWSDGVDVEKANADLAEATGTEVFGPRLPSDVRNLWDVKELPRALAAFLALLAALAVVHALVSTVRMRRQDLAVLRTLGFERRQLASTVVWQATTIGVVGLLVGVPLGLVVGRLVWRAVASSIGVVDDPVVPLPAVLVVIVSVLAILVLTAVLPGRAARRVPAGAVLRSG